MHLIYKFTAFLALAMTSTIAPPSHTPSARLSPVATYADPLKVEELQNKVEDLRKYGGRELAHARAALARHKSLILSAIYAKSPHGGAPYPDGRSPFDILRLLDDALNDYYSILKEAEEQLDGVVISVLGSGWEHNPEWAQPYDKMPVVTYRRYKKEYERAARVVPKEAFRKVMFDGVFRFQEWLWRKGYVEEGMLMG